MERELVFKHSAKVIMPIRSFSLSDKDSSVVLHLESKLFPERGWSNIVLIDSREEVRQQAGLMACRPINQSFFETVNQPAFVELILISQGKRKIHQVCLKDLTESPTKLWSITRFQRVPREQRDFKIIRCNSL